jgi:hypothetical protein
VSEVGDVGPAIQKAAEGLIKNWTHACEALLVSQRANPRSWVLVTQQRPDGQIAWAQPQNEPIRVRYPMVQLRYEGMSVSVRLIESAENGGDPHG